MSRKKFPERYKCLVCVFCYHFTMIIKVLTFVRIYAQVFHKFFVGDASSSILIFDEKPFCNSFSYSCWHTIRNPGTEFVSHFCALNFITPAVCEELNIVENLLFTLHLSHVFMFHIGNQNISNCFLTLSTKTSNTLPMLRSKLIGWQFFGLEESFPYFKTAKIRDFFHCPGKLFKRLLKWMQQRSPPNAVIYSVLHLPRMTLCCLPV